MDHLRICMQHKEINQTLMTVSISCGQHHSKSLWQKVSGIAGKNCQQAKAQNIGLLFKLSKPNQRNPEPDNLRKTTNKADFQIISHHNILNTKHLFSILLT